ncbi:MAG: hypothetical protein LBN93_10615 [Candidatus Symbiothrix sp.]|jgi:hypothetical protein|nr:hypothetical protein [Candidatus Symbiothrix sp.]
MTDRNTLKNWFVRGAKPLASQFAEWIDSFWHKNDNIPAGSIQGLQQLLDEKASDSAVNNWMEEINNVINNISGLGAKSFVCGGDDEFIWPAAVQFTEITMSDTIDTVVFKAGGTTYNDIVGVELPADTMLEIVINLKAGYDKGVIRVAFMNIDEE